MARLGGGTKSGGGAKAAPRPKAVVRAKPSGGSFVGLDIGTQTIKMVEVSGAGSGLRVTALAIENTPPGTVQQGVIADSKALGAAIKQMRVKNGIRATKCVSSVAGAAGMVVRVIEVPKMTPSELAETMKWEVERHIPFAASDVEMSFQKIDNPESDNDPNNPNMEVLLAVAQRDMIAQHIATVTAAGLTPLVIDVEPLAVGRALIDLSKEGLKKERRDCQHGSLPDRCWGLQRGRPALPSYHPVGGRQPDPCDCGSDGAFHGRCRGRKARPCGNSHGSGQEWPGR